MRDFKWMRYMIYHSIMNLNKTINVKKRFVVLVLDVFYLSKISYILKRMEYHISLIKYNIKYKYIIFVALKCCYVLL